MQMRPKDPVQTHWKGPRDSAVSKTCLSDADVLGSEHSDTHWTEDTSSQVKS